MDLTERIAACVFVALIAAANVGGGATKAEIGKACCCVAYTAENDVAVVFADGGVASRAVPESCASTLRRLRRANQKTTAIAFHPDGGYVVVYGKRGYCARQIPVSLADELADANACRETIYSVAFTGDGGWVLLTSERWRWSGNVPRALVERMKTARDEGASLQNVSFNASGGWRLFCVTKDLKLRVYSEGADRMQRRLARRAQWVRVG